MAIPIRRCFPRHGLWQRLLIREHFRPSVEPLRQLLAELPAHNRLKRLLVGTPAPLFDNGEIRKRLWEGALVRREGSRYGA